MKYSTNLWSISTFSYCPSGGGSAEVALEAAFSYKKKLYGCLIMTKKLIISLFLLGVTSLSLGTTSLPLETLYNQVSSLHLEHKGYILGAPLSSAQQAKALSHLVEGSAPGTYKFMDNNLGVVADAANHRVLIIFESFKKVFPQRIQDLVGNLFMQFDEPTVSAHDKIIYWAYDAKGKIPASKYQAAKDEKKHLTILATVKLNSDIAIMTPSDTDTTPPQSNAYYIISSPILLKEFQKNSSNE
ncbi:hypothetical protein SAMN02746065_101273 [Desulfocicer vacuolatum DSM 3385]|uniref:Uncharacterized protein n=1 Tax=Desulfocicer vacuolatum DSM 3385 TaxID=1121400 RepID=A0A1W1YR78_9BACT|nr:hypothetical protein [Desulfocicer vacuolatum]SMC38677.1 hypothetical protein SAMN02746065_101273 [Desulfocicer vacuolatum DSM 3385]